MTRGSEPADNVAPDEDQLARAGAYSLLGALLAAPPNGDLLHSLRELPPGDGLLAPAWDSLAKAAGEARPESLEDEYHALFIGLGRGELVPYASWYLTGFLMEKPLAQLRAELRELGFTRQEGVAEPEAPLAELIEQRRARHQHRRRHGKLETGEPGPSEQIGQRQPFRDASSGEFCHVGRDPGVRNHGIRFCRLPAQLPDQPPGFILGTVGAVPVIQGV